jgi:arylsulfatase A-like enzyme
MITTLKQLDLYDNTIIVYTSDHGEFMGFHHLLLKGNHMYDPLIKVPLLIKYPQQQFAGTVSGDLVNNVDLAPALLSQASAPMPGTMSKVDLTPGAPAHDIVFAEAARGQQYMARTRRHKLLLCRNPAHSQFFDLNRDPFEMNNLIADPSCQPHIDTLRRRLADWILFARTTPAHLDLDAPVIKASNVPDRDDEHVQQGIDYFEAQMSQSFEFTL